jgi:hypothetical protein
MLGVQKGWQARVIDKIVNDTMHMYWHPYREEWALVRVKVGGEWVLTPDYVTSEEDDRKWGPSKYRTAPGAARR